MKGVVKMNAIEVPISEVNEFSEVVKTEEAVNLETARALSDGGGE